MSDTATTTAAEPTQRQMRTYLRTHKPELGVGTRGFLSKDAIKTYREAHGLPTEA